MPNVLTPVIHSADDDYVDNVDGFDVTQRACFAKLKASISSQTSPLNDRLKTELGIDDAIVDDLQAYLFR